MSQTYQPQTPFKGLSPYEIDDAFFFFGREKECAVIAANLRTSKLTLVYGPSGVGKSSLLNAGVAYQLREKARQHYKISGKFGYVVVQFNTWQYDPIETLKSVINEAIKDTFLAEKTVELSLELPFVECLKIWTAKTKCSLLIILDQFEEYALYHPNESGELSFFETFPDAVCDPDLPVHFLISLREDTLGTLDRFKGRIPNLFDNRKQVNPLNREAGRSAIYKPIEQFNKQQGEGSEPITIQPELVNEVLKQVERGKVSIGSSGQGVIRTEENTRAATDEIETPYLSLVMERLWEEEMNAQSKELRLSTLTKLESAEKIVEAHLYEELAQLSPDQQDICASIFNYLVTPSGTKIAHAAGDLAKYSERDAAEISTVMQTLSKGKARIIRTLPDGRFEIFHDVLAKAILAWRESYINKKKAAEVQLKQEQENAAKLAEAEQARREAEEKQLRQQLADAEKLRYMEQQGRQRTRGWLKVALLLAGVTLLAAGFAFYQRSIAMQQAKLAQTEEAKARHAALSAKASELVVKGQIVYEENPLLGMQLALEGLLMLPEDEKTRSEELRIVANDLTKQGRLLKLGDGDSVEAIYTPENTNWFITTYAEKAGERRNFNDGKVIETFPDVVYNVIFSPDGRWFVVNYLYTPGELRETANPEKAYPLDDVMDYVNFSPDSKWFVEYSYYSDIATTLREIANPEIAYSLAGDVDDVTFSPDSKWFVVHHYDTPGELRETANPETPASLPLAGIVNDVFFSPDSKWFIVHYEDVPDELRYVDEPEIAVPLSGIADTSIFFSPDGKWFIVTYSDAPTEMRYVAEPETAYPFTDDANFITFSPDGKWFVLSYEDTPSELHQTANPETTEPLPLVGKVYDVTFSPDSKWFIVHYIDAPGELREITNPETVHPLAGIVYDVTFSPDSKWFVVHYGDASTELREVASPETTTDLGLGLQDVGGLFFDASYKRLVVTYDDGRSYLLDLDWIRAMGGRDNLSVEELVQLACDWPLKLGLVTPEDLKPFLGEDESKVCK